MENNDIKSIWQAYDKKLEKSLVLNKKIIKEIQSQKATAKINSFLRGHAFVMAFGVLWVLLLAFLLFHSLNKIYFAISVGGILLFNVYAVALYAYHITIILSINIADSIIETQRKIAQVNTSFNDAGRILLLQSPFYCTFWYTQELVDHAGPLFWCIQLAIVTFFTFGSFYLYRKLDPKKGSNKLSKLSNKLFGSHKLQMAASFLNEIEDFEKEGLDE